MSKEFCVFDEVANILYFYSVVSCDFSFLEKRLLEMHDESEIIFQKVLSSLLLNYADVEDVFSKDFRKMYIDKSENL